MAHLPSSLALTVQPAYAVGSNWANFTESLWNFQATFFEYVSLKYVKKIDFSKNLQCFATLIKLSQLRIGIIYE